MHKVLIQDIINKIFNSDISDCNSIWHVSKMVVQAERERFPLPK